MTHFENYVYRARDYLYNQLLSAGWFLWHYRGFRWVLQANHDLYEPIPFKPLHWHLGSRYFKCSRGAAKEIVFVKATDTLRVRNEANALRRLQAHSNCAPRLLVDNLDGDYPFLALEWLEARTLGDALQQKCDGKQLESWAAELVHLLDVLDRANIIHRDLHPGNILVLQSSPKRCVSLAMIDFAFAVIDGQPFPDSEYPIATIRTLGDGLNPSPFVWDDAYSCSRILDLLEEAAGEDFASIRQALAQRIGKRICVSLTYR